MLHNPISIYFKSTCYIYISFYAIIMHKSEPEPPMSKIATRYLFSLYKILLHIITHTKSPINVWHSILIKLKSNIISKQVAMTRQHTVVVVLTCCRQPLLTRKCDITSPLDTVFWYILIIFGSTSILNEFVQ